MRLLGLSAVVIIGLLYRSSWGYWLAILLYLQQSIMQSYWAYQALMRDGSIFRLLVTCPLVIGALLVLILNQKIFVERDPYLGG